jgi:hypothetical protein
MFVYYSSYIIFLFSYKVNASYLLLETTFMTITNKLTSIPSTTNKETASVLSKIYWEIRNQRNELINLINQDQTLMYFENLILQLESQMDISLEAFCNSSMTGKWAISNTGVGPVTATRLLNYIDIIKSRTPEHLWSYAGLVPKQPGKQKLTYNNNLKEVCIDLGKNFVKYSAKDNCFYGKLYLAERMRRIELNEKGEYTELANDTLNSANLKDKAIQKDKSVYLSGKLPQERIDAQAQRYAVKIFLAHWHAVAYYEIFNIEYETHHKNIIPVHNSPF